MTSRPPGVSQRIDLPGGASYLSSVLQPNWKRFCYQKDADNLLAQLKQQFPQMTFSMVEDGEEMARYVFTDPNAPRIYLISGNDALGNADFEEDAGELLTRMVLPEGEDRGGPYRAGDVLQMNLDYRFGEAFFFWTKVGSAPASSTAPGGFQTSTPPVTTPPAAADSTAQAPAK